MTEVENLYSLAGVEKIELDYPDNFEPFYPEFTAEKQIGLINWLTKIEYSDERIIHYYKGNYFCLYSWDDFKESELFETYEEALACVINYIWQDLTEAEQNEIREILK